MSIIQSAFLFLCYLPFVILLFWPIAGVDRPDRSKPWRRTES